MSSSVGSTVLVTGASGFLGQHVVGLLQAHAPHVTAIRVLDVVPYKNKLDYEETKPVKQFIGSIDDITLLREACQDVSCVMHIAGIVDVSLFPDDKKLMRVNVQGTSTLLDVCKEVGVQRFIYCSSVSVVVGDQHVINGVESKTTVPNKFLFNGYSSTKLKAETIVLKANCDSFRTVSIRPAAMFGEEDPAYVTLPLILAKKFRYWPVIDCKDTLHQAAYVGNVAWMFICADKTMLKDARNKTGGQAFNATDDTPIKDMFEIRTPFAAACNNKTEVYKFPVWLVLGTLYIIYFLLLILSPIVKLNFPYGFGSFEQMRISYTFKYEKAKSRLGYRPLYDYKNSVQRSMNFYKRYSK